MASAPCGNGSCLYIADIGDNDAKRKEVTIYRVPEPRRPADRRRSMPSFARRIPMARMMRKRCSPPLTARSTS